MIIHAKLNEIEKIDGLKRPALIFDVVTGYVRKIGEYDEVLNEYNETKEMYERMNIADGFKGNIFIDVEKYI